MPHQFDGKFYGDISNIGRFRLIPETEIYLKEGITTSGGLLSGGDPGAAGILSGWGEWAMLLRAS